jgi:hypothetical protein
MTTNETTKTMTAMDYASAREKVVIFYAGNGAPAGADIAWIPTYTELPFDLSEIEGEVDADGDFTATNLNDGSGARGWRFHDWNLNIVYKLQLRVDEKVWDREYADLMSEA